MVKPTDGGLWSWRCGDFGEGMSGRVREDVSLCPRYPVASPVAR